MIYQIHHFKGVRAHLEDLEQWKKGFETKVANIAASIPRQQGRLPGQAGENPKGHHIAAVTLRSGKELEDVEPRRKEEEVAQQPHAGRHDPDVGRQNSTENFRNPEDADAGRQAHDAGWHDIETGRQPLPAGW